MDNPNPVHAQVVVFLFVLALFIRLRLEYCRRIYIPKNIAHYEGGPVENKLNYMAFEIFAEFNDLLPNHLRLQLGDEENAKNLDNNTYWNLFLLIAQFFGWVLLDGDENNYILYYPG